MRTWEEKYSANVAPFLKMHDTFTNEDVIDYMLSKGLERPLVGNTWGAMFQLHFSKSPYVVRTGKTTNAKTPSSKGRLLVNWRSLLCPVAKQDSLNKQLISLRARVLTKELDMLQALKMAAQLGSEATI